jgi:16S rRNA (cytosine1402-N4)-methyltransferase
MYKDEFHTPVLLKEAIEYLLNPEINFHSIADCTLGGGGYSELICEKTSPESKVICIDKDLNALEYAEKKLSKYKEKTIFVNGNFGELKGLLTEIGIEKVTGIVMDLGLSSYQLEAEEGFSFMKDTPLDMRAFKKNALTAGSIVNEYTAKELMRVFVDYGEIGNAGRLVEAIERERRAEEIKTTFDLVKLVDGEYKIDKKNRVNFLAKIFQALRIEVNGEMENLERVLGDSVELLEKGGRLVAVSYHSLEDRIVKNFLREKSKREKVSKYKKEEVSFEPVFKLLTKKAVTPGFEEVKHNSRARSAKLRAVEKL